jgi:hypothetical protein
VCSNSFCENPGEQGDPERFLPTQSATIPVLAVSVCRLHFVRLVSSFVRALPGSGALRLLVRGSDRDLQDGVHEVD